MSSKMLMRNDRNNNAVLNFTGTASFVLGLDESESQFTISLGSDLETGKVFFISTDGTTTIPGLVTSLTDGSILTSNLSSGCVDGTKIADNAIDSEHLVDGCIDAVHLEGTLPTGCIVTSHQIYDPVTGGDYIYGKESAIEVTTVNATPVKVVVQPAVY